MFSADSTACNTCPGRVVCRCLHVTEEEVVTALAIHGVSSVLELRRVTGAGDGCTACHRKLALLIAESSYSSSDPICSVK
jgi:bacterioferritin-associated ferredoxin